MGLNGEFKAVERKGRHMAILYYQTVSEDRKLRLAGCSTSRHMIEAYQAFSQRIEPLGNMIELT